MSRTLLPTPTPGWYVDPTQPERKVRKAAGDQVVQSMGNGSGSPIVVAETGKILAGKTVEIECQWQQEGKLCGRKRTIKPQDAFQVRFCVEHQQERLKQRRRDAARRRAARKRASQS